jgi:hypothetical protein
MDGNFSEDLHWPSSSSVVLDRHRLGGAPVMKARHYQSVEDDDRPCRGRQLFVLLSRQCYIPIMENT